jgi:hypothetical protein
MFFICETYLMAYYGTCVMAFGNIVLVAMVVSGTETFVTLISKIMIL